MSIFLMYKDFFCPFGKNNDVASVMLNKIYIIHKCPPTVKSAAPTLLPSVLIEHVHHSTVQSSSLRRPSVQRSRRPDRHIALLAYNVTEKAAGQKMPGLRA